MLQLQKNPRAFIHPHVSLPFLLLSLYLQFQSTVLPCKFLSFSHTHLGRSIFQHPHHPCRCSLADAQQYSKPGTENLNEFLCRGYLHIMEAYSRLDECEKVVQLFHEFESRKLRDSKKYLAQIYGILCESLGKSGKAFEALEIIGEDLEVVKEMKDADVKVSDCVLCAIINGFSKRRGFLAAAKVYEQLISQGYEPGQVTYASAINAYCRLGQYNKAEKRRKIAPDKVTYTSIIGAYSKESEFETCIQLFNEYRINGGVIDKAMAGHENGRTRLDQRLVISLLGMLFQKLGCNYRQNG
ncbi:Tetratricopeptide-like helical domain superfamily [Sesbania bispinosa]|nr:Tetratricopeptide-like helical domain superfamily [Sesbania bispinosa]